TQLKRTLPAKKRGDTPSSGVPERPEEVGSCRCDLLRSSESNIPFGRQTWKDRGGKGLGQRRTRSSPTAPTAPTAPPAPTAPTAPEAPGPGPRAHPSATFPPLLRTDPQHSAPGGPPTLYSTCIFCNGALGTNEVLEDFPVGRRIAFDAARGRLWLVCRR